MKYQLLAAYPGLFFCDPDYYPVARADELDLARQRFPELQSNREEFGAILSYLGLSAQTSFSDADKLAIYREHKRLAAVQFELTSSVYRFQFQIKDTAGQGFLLSGTIDGNGNVNLQQRQPAIVTCPICLAGGTLIDTPTGSLPVSQLRVGDLVWTADRTGTRFAAPILQASHVPVPSQHVVVHVVLSDGRELRASPGHPAVDGRLIGSLRPGDSLDGAYVVEVSREAYDQRFTYDILPAGETGFYWANGVLLASTLR